MEQKIARQIMAKLNFATENDKEVNLTFEQFRAVQTFIDFILNTTHGEFNARMYQHAQKNGELRKDIQIKITEQGIVTGL